LNRWEKEKGKVLKGGKRVRGVRKKAIGGPFLSYFGNEVITIVSFRGLNTITRFEITIIAI